MGMNEDSKDMEGQEIARQEERRKERRYPIDSILFPFLGTRHEDHVSFEYLPLDISPQGLRITIPRWLVSREQLKQGNRINLHVPFELDRRSYDQGRIAWAGRDNAIDAEVYGIEVTRRKALHNPVYFCLTSRGVGIDLEEFQSVEDLEVRVLKDIFLLKKGVLVYLNHLVPYFYRIGKYPSEDYPLLKEMFLDDIRNRVREHRDALEALYDRIHKEDPGPVELSGFLDLEELRGLVESEISLEILRTTFQSEAVMPYLGAIKELEKKLYENYNAVVMLYIKSL